VTRPEGPADVLDPAPLPRLSPDALRVLRGHRAGVPAYLSWALGPINSPAGLAPIDAAYADLTARGLVAASERALSVLRGEDRSPFVLTAEGDRVRRMGPAAGA
jgi:hypothetical protein